MFRFRSAAVAAGMFCALAAPLDALAQTPLSAQDPKAFYPFILKLMKDEPKTRENMRGTLGAPGEPMPANKAALDAMLDKGKYQELLTALLATNSYDEVSQNLNWERQKVYDGAGIAVTIAYLRDLWRVGEALKGSSGEDLKQTAVAMGLYVYAVTSIDGVRCEDAAAPAFRRQQLFTENPFLWAYAKGLPKDSRDRAETVALVFEATTGPVRKDDEILCLGQRTGSMVEMIQGMAAMAKAGESPKPVQRPGQIGQSYEITRARPKFLKAEVWAPLQPDLRKPMPDELEQVLARGGPPK